MVEVHRLLDEIESAIFHGGHRIFDGAESGDENDRDGGVGLFGVPQDVQAGAAGKLEVGQNQQKSTRADLGDGGGAIGGLFDRIAGTLQRLAQHGGQFGVVFGQ